MKSKLIQWIAIGLILQIGLIHIFNAQAEYEEAEYLGYLFAANFFGALVAALGIFHRQVWGWILGLVIATGSIAAYCWSRTLGMPGMEVEEWLTPFGVVSLGVESVFILLVFLRPWKIPAGALLSPAKFRIYPFMPAVGLLLILSISAFTLRWDYEVTQNYGLHIGSLSQVNSTPVTSLADLEIRYGVEISLVATSMMDSIVDVRLKIIDPDKAHEFLQNQAGLLVGQDALILAPHMHSHNITRLKPGKIFSVFFSTDQRIHNGSEVSLVFGSIRSPAVIVQ